MPNDIPFRRDLEFEYGVTADVSPLVRRVVARNPGNFTLHGTGTYIIGRGRVAVVDPGPRIDAHIEAIARGVDGETVTHILVTHTHIDHSPATYPLQAITGGAVYGYGPHGAGKIEQGVQVEEGGDMDFVPENEVRHGDVIAGDGWTVECVYTPGHTSNHVCFRLLEEKTLFSGDHVMGWSTTIVSPPDGDMADYLASLRLLLDGDDAVYLPTHGPAITDPKPFVRALIVHRKMRQAQILDCVGKGLDTIAQMVPVMYAKAIPESMYPAAARSVFAAVIHLVEDGQLRCDGALAVEATYSLP